ncbi:hypothetical protein GJ744_007029 [Endocarpon pusillum]|uniref:RTA1 domain protein n=1 Tax=Endocarpon pusillum TaxID=364733 RepID=A0A8H7E6D9_9EURO|nr:hypothetical protein GJ744_007029 [Endocarpon pusillum]
MAGELTYRDIMMLWFYGIKPSWVIAVIATFLFSCATLVHLVILFRQRVFFAFPLIAGSLFEVVGYGFRAAGLHEEIPNPSTYVTYSTLITLAPGFIAASLYQLLAHIILANGLGNTQLITKLGLGCGFGILDVLGYALQAAGMSKLQTGPFGNSLQTGPSGNSTAQQLLQLLLQRLQRVRSLLLAGNIITLINLSLFTGLTTYYLVVLLRRGRSSTHPYPSTVAVTAEPGLISHTPLTLLLISLGLLLTRTIYRTTAAAKGLVDEWGKDASVYPLRVTPLFSERWNYGFDALMVFLLLVAWAAWFPTRDRLGEDEVDGGVATQSSSAARIWPANWTGAAGPGGLLGAARRWFGRRRERGMNVRMEGFSRA